MEESIKYANKQVRIRIGLGITILGFVVFVLGVDPAIFGLNQSPMVGIRQITVFLVGLGLICVGGYIALNALWNGKQKTIAGDIGLRLVATGYLISVVSGLADVFGFGNQPLPTPAFGEWQLMGVVIGEIVIAFGFLLLIPVPSRNRVKPWSG